MGMKIHINGFASFEAFRDAGYPGARSFPKDEPVVAFPVCVADGCDNHATAHRGMCFTHYRRDLEESLRVERTR